jgi:hypothetical protein
MATVLPETYTLKTFPFLVMITYESDLSIRTTIFALVRAINGGRLLLDTILPSSGLYQFNVSTSCVWFTMIVVPCSANDNSKKATELGPVVSKLLPSCEILQITCPGIICVFLNQLLPPDEVVTRLECMLRG